MEGWICLHRILMDKPIWRQSTPAHKTVLIALLLMASHKESEWTYLGETYQTKPGQFVTSLESIRKNCGKGVSVEQIRRALVKFQKADFCTNKSTKTGRLITICNWEKYQVELKDNRQRKRQTTDKEPTPINNETTKQEYIYAFYNETIRPKHKTKQRAVKNIETYLKKRSVQEMEQAILNYKSTLNGTSPKYRKGAANFFGINEPYAKDFFQENFERPEPEDEPQTPS